MPNRLAAETSPYLKQHADNPVDWYPWDEEALALARAQDKPILLSIGYSACHWCHVMAHESFEDADVAALMNRLFVNIKVDREERPDLDQIYQLAHAMLTRRNGGWPLTVFLTPQQVPFVAGTYFPKMPRYGMPGFAELLPRIAEAYRTRRSDIEQQSASLLGALAATVPTLTEAGHADDAPLHAAVRELREVFDPEHGGLGKAPKFPHPYELEFLLRQHAAGDAEALAIVRLTLQRMAEGGIYDQVGGGFCRYSVDATWTIPHFEKMLYDNGPLLALYADAWRVTGDPLFARVVEETATWVLREMQSPEGGFYSSLDADSEHEEGKFYVWTPDEMRACLNPEEYAVVVPHYGLDAAPNFEGKHWHLRIAVPLPEVAARTGHPLARCRELLNTARSKLLAARDRRIRPGRDDKILTSWNALMVRGLARAGRQFGRQDWIAVARRAVEFLRTTMWHGERLYATHKGGKAHLNAYLDDYAFLLDAILELLQADFRADELEFACVLADALLDRFEDAGAGGFFFTSHDHERLIHRPKPGHDNATPSGNGVAAYALQRLGSLLAESRYVDATHRTLTLFQQQLAQRPSACASLLGALAVQLEPAHTLVLRGPAATVAQWQTRVLEGYRPNLVCLGIPNGTPGLPPSLAHPETDRVNAWLCRGVTCLPPTADLAVLLDLLDQDG